jgi:hypothetical protein
MSADRITRPLLVGLSIAVSGCGAPAMSGSTTSSVSTVGSPPVPAAELRAVAVAELAVEGASGDTIAATPGTLHEGDLVWVLRSDDPDRASHLIAAASTATDEATLPFGWVPADVDGVPSLRAADLSCPQPDLTVEALATLTPMGGLACFGAQPITFVGYTPIGCGVGGSPRTGTPEWLNGTWSAIGIGSEEPVPPDFAVEVAIGARAEPDLGLEQCGSPGWYRFVGHFDDPASATCRTETTTPDGARPISIDPLLSQLLCRTHLVLTVASALTPP